MKPDAGKPDILTVLAWRDRLALCSLLRGISIEPSEVPDSVTVLRLRAPSGRWASLMFEGKEGSLVAAIVDEITARAREIEAHDRDVPWEREEPCVSDGCDPKF